MIRRIQEALHKVSQCRRLNTYIGGVQEKEEQCGGVSTKELDVISGAASFVAMGDGHKLGALFITRHFNGLYGLYARIGSDDVWFSFPVTKMNYASEEGAWEEFQERFK